MAKLRILVVDGSTITVGKLSGMFEELGHEVVGTAATGEQAIQDYESLSPDLVSMDITLPDMDGIEATRRILEQDPDALIVVAASPEQEQMVMDAMDTGAKGSVLKPVDKDRLGENLAVLAEKYLP